MKFNTEHLNRCIKTLESSLAMLDKAEPDSLDYEIYRNAVVKGFELTLEISGKLLRKALKQYKGSPRTVDELVFKDLFREALKHGILDDQESVERWFDYRNNRNNTAHDYGIGFAHDTLSLMPAFLKDVHSLETRLKERYGDD